MSDPAPEPRGLPPRPSLLQLRKQAKELLRSYRAGDAAATERVSRQIPRLAAADPSNDFVLADAQFVLAREYGFESWAHLARHVASGDPLVREAEALATEIAAAYAAADYPAIREINWRRGTAFYWSRVPIEMHRCLPNWFGSEDRSPALALADARLLVARQFDAESWEELVASRGDGERSPATGSVPSPSGDHAEPVFYHFVPEENGIAVRRPLDDREWDTVFAVMKERNITAIMPGPITDAALGRLAAIDHVTRLGLGDSPRLTDEGLLHIARMPQLRELDLSGYRSAITDRGLAALRHLPELRRFRMCWPPKVSDAGVANLRHCEHLEEVDLLGTPTGDGVLAALAGKPKLRHLKSGRLVTDAGLPLLHQFPAFARAEGGEPRFGLMSFDAGPTHLLIDGPFTGAGLASLAGLEGIVGLSFFWHTTVLTPTALAALAALPNLAFLGCEGRLCDDEAMRHIAAIPRLRMLMGQGTVATDDGFEALSRSRTIEYIWGRECPNLGGRGFRALGAMPALRGLAVSCKGVDDDALATLPRFPALTDFMAMDVSDDGFRHIGRCERIEALWCMYCRDTGDAAVTHIASLPRLASYYAGDTGVTDRGLETLATMDPLEKLEFWHCTQPTDDGVAALARLPRLRELTLDGLPRVTRAVLKRFPPNVRVSYSP